MNIIINYQLIVDAQAQARVGPGSGTPLIVYSNGFYNLGYPSKQCLKHDISQVEKMPIGLPFLLQVP